MTIDIVDYSPEIYDVLTSRQYYKIEQGQQRKNTLLGELEEKIRRKRQAFIENGTYVSELFEKAEEKLRKEYEIKIELVKNEVLTYIEGTMKQGCWYNFEVEYPVNYALTTYQRFKYLERYYRKAYPNAAERFAAFKKDSFAASYIPDYYEALYSLFGGEV